MTISYYKNDKVECAEIELYEVKDSSSTLKEIYPTRYIVEGRIKVGERDIVFAFKPYSDRDRAIDEYNRLTRILGMQD